MQDLLYCNTKYNNVMLTVNYLRQLKRTAMRKRVWYQRCSDLDRGIVNLTIKTLRRVRSYLLSEIIHNIIDDIQAYLQSCFQKHVETFGKTKATELVEQSRKLGIGGQKWMKEPAFPRFLAMIDYNNPPGWQQRGFQTKG